MNLPDHDHSTVEIQQVIPDTEQHLAVFFTRLQSCSIEQYFHPHPLTSDEARKRARYSGPDFYCVLRMKGEIQGYGMLRGWEEGYEIPSLGIVIHPDKQGQGLGRMLIQYLHQEAQCRGAKKIRLRVAPENRKALSLYKSIGYKFSTVKEGPYQVGVFELVQ